MPLTLDKLPSELLLNVFDHLSTPDVLLARFVCKTFYQLAQPILKVRQASASAKDFNQALANSHYRLEKHHPNDLTTLFCRRCKTVRSTADFADSQVQQRRKHSFNSRFCLHCGDYRDGFVYRGAFVFASCLHCKGFVSAKHYRWGGPGKRVCAGCWYDFSAGLSLGRWSQWRFMCDNSSHWATHRRGEPCDVAGAHLASIKEEIKAKGGPNVQRALKWAASRYRNGK